MRLPGLTPKQDLWPAVSLGSIAVARHLLSDIQTNGDANEQAEASSCQFRHSNGSLFVGLAFADAG